MTPVFTPVAAGFVGSFWYFALMGLVLAGLIGAFVVVKKRGKG